MINVDLALFLGLWVLVFLYINFRKDKFEVHGKIFALYRTKLGLKAMDSWAVKHPKTLRLLGYLGLVIGFAGMIASLGMIIYYAFKLIFIPGALPGLSPVIPGIEIPGLPFRLSFFHFLIAIFVVAIVHEFWHGVISRVWGIKVKSSGFAFFGPIPAAFVEPDEDSLMQAKPKASLSVFAAGPLANLLLFIPVVLIYFLLLNPMVGSFIQPDGVIISAVPEGLDDQIQIGDRITLVNGMSATTYPEFIIATENIKPGEEVTLTTNESKEFKTVVSQHPSGPGEPYFGFLELSFVNIKPDWQVETFFWIRRLFFWVFSISLGVGLFNLLPLGPLDGGRMIYSTALMFTTEKKAKKVFKWVSAITLGFILINLMPFFLSLVNWIVGIIF